MTSSADRVFAHLTIAQAEGLACVMCGRLYRAENAPRSEQVGRSESMNRVFACSGSCAELANMNG